MELKSSSFVEWIVWCKNDSSMFALLNFFWICFGQSKIRNVLTFAILQNIMCCPCLFTRVRLKNINNCCAFLSDTFSLTKHKSSNIKVKDIVFETLKFLSFHIVWHQKPTKVFKSNKIWINWFERPVHWKSDCHLLKTINSRGLRWQIFWKQAGKQKREVRHACCY